MIHGRKWFFILLKISLVATDQNYEVNEVPPQLSKDVKDICSEPQDPGYCEFGLYSRKWYYDSYYNYCKRFWYSGCKGNDNRFKTLMACVESCVRDETTIDVLTTTHGQVDTSDYIDPDMKEETIKDWKYLVNKKTNDTTMGVRQTTHGQMHTSNYIDPDMEEGTTKDWKDYENVITIVIDWPGFDEPEKVVPRKRHLESIFAAIAICAVLFCIRVSIVKYRRSQHEILLLRGNNEAGRNDQQAPCSDDSSPARISVLVISLSKRENQSSNESTEDNMHKSDQNFSTTQPFQSSVGQFPPAPPPYKP